MEKAILVRIHEVPVPAGIEDGEYTDGLQSAVSAGVGYGLAGIEEGDDHLSPIPAALFAQARQAARSGVTLDVVLRRLIAGYTLLSDFVMQEVEDGVPLRDLALRPVLHVQATRFERLVGAVTSEYTREYGHRRRPPERRHIERVKDLLAGELGVDTGELAYEFDDWHVGAIARGDGATRALRSLAEAADRRLLLVRPERDTAWAWFGGRRRIAMAEIARCVSSDGPGDALIALGEPARGIEGWRLTHEQASAALRIARRGAEGVVLYADVGLLASISQDDVLARSLHQLYLAPLADGRDGGAGLRETLRAYFTAGRNISSAASALGVSRQTVGNRLRAIEGKLGRTLESCAPEIEVALRLEGGGELIDTTLAHPPGTAHSVPNRKDLSIRSDL
ncbi:MAG TPA: helix-turn-helix domain-containing protein [Solirubrobacterales bacterium]